MVKTASPGRLAWSWITARRDRLSPALDARLERAKWAAKRPPKDLKPVPWPAEPGPRVLIAPANSAGQGAAWARALQNAGLAWADNWEFVVNDVFRHRASYQVPVQINGAPLPFQQRQFEVVTANYQAVVLESGLPLFGRLFDFDPAREAQALIAEGLTVAVMWHGSDVRLPSWHATGHPLSPYRLPELKRQTATWEATAKRHRRVMGAAGLPELVSTPDLVDAVPGAKWCPVVVDRFNGSDQPILQGEVPKVVHVPSNSWLKGTDLVEPTLQQLATEGVIEYVQATELSSAEVRELYQSADVVVDQFRMGIYGVAAVEAMARGRLVISDVDQSVRDRVRQVTGRDLPIWQTSATDLRVNLERVVAHPEQARQMADAGRSFARAVHSGSRSAQMMAQALKLDF